MATRTIVLCAGVAMWAQVQAAVSAEQPAAIYTSSGTLLSQPGCVLQEDRRDSAGSRRFTFADRCFTPGAAAECKDPTYLVNPNQLALGKGVTGSFTVALSCSPASPITVTARSGNASIATVTPHSVGIGDTTPRKFDVVASDINKGSATIDLNGSAAYANNAISDVAVTVGAGDCSDPLTQIWRPVGACVSSANVPVTIKAGIQNSATFAPGDTRTKGTFKDNEIFGIRHFFSGGAQLAVIEIDRAEGGEEPATYDVALSRIPGSFTETRNESGAVVPIPKVCAAAKVGFKTLYAQLRSKAGTRRCPLDAGQYYYFNIRVAGPQGCGADGKECRIQSHSTIPH